MTDALGWDTMVMPRRGIHGGEHHTSQGTPHRERTQMGDRLEDDGPDWGVRPRGRRDATRDLPVLGDPGRGCGACKFLEEPCAFHRVPA